MFLSHSHYITHVCLGMCWCAEPSAPPESAELCPRCINKCITLWKWVRVGQSSKSQGQFCRMDLQPLPKAAALVTPERQQGGFVSQCALRAKCSLALWHGQTHQTQINPNWLSGTCSRKSAQDAALELKSFPAIFLHCSNTMQWLGRNFLKSLCEGLSSSKGFC